MLRRILKYGFSKRLFFSSILIFLSIFYKKDYLKGRWFDYNKSIMGYLWGLRGIMYQKVLGFNRKVPWPISPLVTLSSYRNIYFDINDLNNFWSPGCYFQNFSGRICIGKGTYIGPNVGLITANHDYHDLDNHRKGEDVIIGRRCWIGMNSVILPGVVLGDNTVVAAGSIVGKNRKYIRGNIMIGGNPAQVLYSLKKDDNTNNNSE